MQDIYQIRRNFKDELLISGSENRKIKNSKRRKKRETLKRKKKELVFFTECLILSNLRVGLELVQSVDSCLDTYCIR